MKDKADELIELTEEMVGRQPILIDDLVGEIEQHASLALAPIEDDGDAEAVAVAINSIKRLVAVARASDKALTQALMDYNERNDGDLEVEFGDMVKRYYNGIATTYKRKTPVEDLMERVFDFVEGDWKHACEFLSSNPFKVAKLKAIFGEQSFAMMYDAVETPALKTATKKAKI